MPDDTKPANGGGAMTAVWRWAVIVSLMGMAFTGGMLRSGYETRIDHLEKRVQDYAPGVEARNVRMDQMESAIATLRADVLSLQMSVARIDRALERQSDRQFPR